MRVVLVHNAGSGSAGEVDAATLLRELGCDVVDADLQDVLRWGQRPPLSKLAGVERVIVAGGDGSVAPAGDLALTLDVALGVVPAGTANDFARMLELPDDGAEALRVAATGSIERDIDLCTIDGRSFVNVASLGVAEHASRHALPLKRMLGPLAYPVGALLGVARADPIHVDIAADAAPAWSGDAWQVMVAGTGGFGGFAQTGEIRDGDGLLDLFVVPAERGGHRLVLDAAALRLGNLAERDGVVHVRARRITLRTHRRTHLVVDGERVKSRHRLIEAGVASRPLRVVVA